MMPAVWALAPDNSGSSVASAKTARKITASSGSARSTETYPGVFTALKPPANGEPRGTKAAIADLDTVGQ